MQYTVNLKAGIRQWVSLQGRFFMVLETGAAASVALQFDLAGSNAEEIQEAKRGTKVRLLAERFQRVEFLSSVDAAIVCIVSDNEVDYDFMAGTSVQATIAGPLPLPVSNDRGSPGNLLHVAGVTLADAPAVAVSAGAPVPCTSVTAVLCAANANRRSVRFLNIGPDPVAIGPAGSTWAQRVIVLEVGDVWLEDRAANLAWSGICDATKTASVGVQEITA